MATIATTSVTNPLQYPASTLIDYTTFDGYWYAMVRATTANTFEVWRTNTGVSWALYASLVRANVAEIGSIYTSPKGWISWCYRTNESGEDRVFYRRLSLTAATWSSEVLMTSISPNGGVAGTVWGGMDVVTVDYGPSGSFQAGIVVIAQASNGGCWLTGFNTLPGGQPQLNNNVMAGNRQFLPFATTTGHHVPSIDPEHAGNGKTSGTPNLWVCYGRNGIFMNKLAWNGQGWLVPSGKVDITRDLTRDYVPGRWDGARFIMVRYSGSTVILYERNQANTTTTTRTTPVHTTGVVRSTSVSYSSTNRNPRVYAVGTSSNDLYYVDYDRLAGTWSGWTLVSATDITGAAVDNFSPRRGTYVNVKHDILTAHAGVDIVHTALAVSFPPLVPTWVFSAVPYVNGSAADANAALLLDWQFNDPDPADTQGSYALRRQIGSDAVQYWQASDSTWQTSEVQNTSSTTQLTLPTGFVDRFDLGVAGAWAPSAATFAATSVQAHSGGTAALLTTVGTPAQATVRYVEIAVSPSTSYSAELWGYSVAGYASFFVAIDWYTSGHVYISTSSSAPAALSAGVWGRRNHTATSPGTAAYAQVGPTVGGNPPASTVIYVDDVSFGAPTPWAAASDANHSYAVKIWDATAIASVYSATLTLVPSAKVDPTISTPVDTSTWSTDTLTVTWTVAEQTAFQAQITFLGIILEDSGKRASTSTSWTFGMDLLDGWNYTVRLYTWNNEGLQSTVDENAFSVRFVAPRTPTVTLSPDPARGYVTVTVTNPPVQTFVAAGTAAQGNNVTLNPALPTGTTGDLLLLLSAIENSGTGTPNLPTPTYTSLATFGNVGLFGKIREAGEAAPSASYAGGAAGAATSAQIVAFREAALAALGNPFTQLNGSAQNILYLGGTPPTANCIMILIVWKQDGAATVTTTPAGFTKIGDIFNATGQTVSWYYQIQTAATAVSSGTVTVTSGGSAISRSLLVPVSGVPLPLYNDIWRIRNGSFGDQIRVLQSVPVNGSGNDWRAVSKQEYLYQAIAIGDNGTSAPGLFTI